MWIGNITFCSTVFHGSRTLSWKIMPMLVRGPAIGMPSTVMLPVVIGSSPAHIISNVDLPQPDGPRMATNSLRRTLNDTPATASSGPVAVS